MLDSHISAIAELGVALKSHGRLQRTLNSLYRASVQPLLLDLSSQDALSSTLMSSIPPVAPRSDLRISQRQPTACRECSRRKVRCDKQIPCSRCVRLSRPCTRETVRISKSLNVYRDELRFLQYVKTLITSEDGIPSAVSEIDRRIQALEHGTPPRETSSEPTPIDTSEITATSQASLVAEARGDDTGVSGPGDGEDNRAVASGRDTAAVEQAQSDNASILTAVEFLAWGRNIKACYPHRWCSCHQHRRYSELVSINSDAEWVGRMAMPAHVREDILLPVDAARKVLDFHLDHLHWHHNAFHGPTFRHKCEQFWLSGTVDHPLWMALYFAVSSVSLWTLLNNAPYRRDLGIVVDEGLVQKQFQAMVNILYEENFLEHLSLYSIQAIVISTRIAHNLNRSDLNATLIGAAVRIAHCLGLHKISNHSRPVSYHEKVEIETGKRVWAQLLIQDHFQIPFTDTYVINPSQYITPVPENCNDADMMEQDSEVATNSSYVITLSRSAAQIPPLIDGLGPMRSRKPVDDMYSHILACDREMRESIKRVPGFLLRDTHGVGNALPWLPLARRTLAISAAEKIIMIHRPVLFYSFQSPAFSKTRETCVSAATTILREHEQTTEGNFLSIWTHSAFCVTAAVVLGLELLHRADHTDSTANRYRQMMLSAAERLRNRRCDAIAQRGAILVDTMLAAEEDLVLRLMRMLPHVGSEESRQRQVINEMIGSQEIISKFLASNPDKFGTPHAMQNITIDEMHPALELYPTADFDSWYNEVFAPMTDPTI